ncbi:MAG: outer membrane beta-barrel family protein [Rikenellaceae bacterium]
MRYIKITLLTLVSILFTSVFVSGQASSNQAARDFKIKLTLLDSLRQIPIEFATVSIRFANASEAIKYALSDAAGKVELSGIPEGTYILKIEYMGYKTYVKSVVFTGEKLVDLGKIQMQEQVNSLDAVIVSAVGNPIIVKKDTVEYNASSFKTTDGDMLETLLKKLPGIDIDSDGKITANGKEITKIMIDGKAFFLNDPTLATKNLPAKIIDKVKVVEKKSEQALFTGIDDGNQETVIDLSIRPGMMNGWFGNLSAGYGTNDRYQGAGMAGNFTSKSQITFVGNGNNTNNRGFMDVAGSMMRGMRNSMGGGGNSGGVRVGGAVMNFGGSGITTSWMGGLNANTESKDKKLKIGGSYLYSGSDNLTESKNFKQNFLQDSTFNYAQQTRSNSVTEGHSASLNLEYQLTDKASILFRPNVNIGYGTFNDTKTFSTDGASGTKINDGNSSSVGDNQSQSLSGDLLFRQKLNKDGRTFSVNVNYGYSNSDMDSKNNSETNIFGTHPQTSLVDQDYSLNNNSYSLGARASYTEPLGNQFFMELAYSYNFKQSNSDKKAYNLNSATNHYDLLDSTYSNSFKNKFITQRGEINIRKIGEKYNLVVGFNVQPSYTKSIDDLADTTYYTRSVINFAPSGMFEYNFSDTKFLRARYRGNTNQPSISQLQPVKDNSNPLYVPIGNPDLLPEFSHSLSIDYRKTKRETFSTMEVEFDGDFTQNKIINKTWYDNGGIQYNMPVNENGIYSLSGNFSYSTPIAKSKYYIATNTRLRFNNGVNYSNGIKNITKNLSTTENLRFSYRGEKIEGGFGGRATYSRAWYSIDQLTKKSTWTNSVNIYANWSLPAGINLTSDFNYLFYIGFGTGYNEPSAVWNAEASKLMFKKMGTLRLKVFDILNQAKSVRRTTTDNYIEDSETNILKQYVMLSFTWRFGTFGGQKGGDRRMRPGEGFRPGSGMRFH